MNIIHLIKETLTKRKIIRHLRADLKRISKGESVWTITEDLKLQVIEIVNKSNIPEDMKANILLEIEGLYKRRMCWIQSQIDKLLEGEKRSNLDD